MCKDDATHTVKPYFQAKKMKHSAHTSKIKPGYSTMEEDQPPMHTLTVEVNSVIISKARALSVNLLFMILHHKMEYPKGGCVLVVKQPPHYSSHLENHILYGQKQWHMDDGSKTRFSPQTGLNNLAVMHWSYRAQ